MKKKLTTKEYQEWQDYYVLAGQHPQATSQTIGLQTAVIVGALQKKGSSKPKVDDFVVPKRLKKGVSMSPEMQALQGVK